MSSVLQVLFLTLWVLLNMWSFENLSHTSFQLQLCWSITHFLQLCQSPASRFKMGPVRDSTIQIYMAAMDIHGSYSQIDASIELKLILFLVFTGLHTNERAVHQESENDYESTQVSSMWHICISEHIRKSVSRDFVSWKRLLPTNCQHCM